MTTTEILSADSDGIERAAALLAAGAVVSFPTETVYGLGADASQARAVANIYRAKGRPSFNPLITHVADLEMADQLGDITPTARHLADAFWPGALTMVVPLRPDAPLAPAVTAGLPSVALRLPDHAIAQSLITALGRGIAAPSANPSGKISPTTARHVQAGLAGRIGAILDGGPCPMGVESTIIDLTGPRAQLLRPGGVTPDDLAEILGYRPEVYAGDAITAPGQLGSHYAPTVSVRLNARDAQPGESLLGFGAMDADENLSPSGDLAEAAARLFAMLHHLEKLGRPIAVAPIPDRGMGLAINDRLRRAAAPR